MTTRTRYGKLSIHSTSLFNHNTRFDNEYVYGNSLEYRPDDRLTLYGALQRIYSVPTLDELYYNNANRDSDGAWKIRGNQHLQPETGLKWNGGIRYRLSDHSTLDANAFVSHSNNPIVWYKETGAWTPKNLESQNKSGFQLTWEDRFSSRYGLTASYAWTLTDTTYGGGIDPQYTDEVAPPCRQGSPDLQRQPLDQQSAVPGRLGPGQRLVYGECLHPGCQCELPVQQALEHVPEAPEPAGRKL